MSDSVEECLRPSLLRKRCQTAHTVSSDHQNNTHQHNLTADRHRTTSEHRCAAFPISLDSFPARRIPFAPLSPGSPSSQAPSQSCLSPTAEHDLFGSPATNAPACLSPVCTSNMFESPGLQQQMRHGPGTSKAMAYITRLQRDRAYLIQQLKVMDLQARQVSRRMLDNVYSRLLSTMTKARL